MAAKDDKNAAAVRKVFDGWIAAIKSRDLEAVVASHADDIVMFDVPEGPPIAGLKAYRKAWKPFLDFLGPKGIFKPGDLIIAAGEGVAFSHCSVRCVGSVKSDGPKQLVRLTLGYRKVEGAWKIMHEHHSVGYLS